jgi:hypothetical protein
MNPRHFYLWGTLNDKVHANNPHPLREMKENILQEISVIPRQICRVSRNIFSRCEAYTEAEVRNFETLLGTKAGHAVWGKAGSEQSDSPAPICGKLP